MCQVSGTIGSNTETSAWTAPIAEAFVDAFAGDDRHVFDYLVAEVLQRQPEATRDFLRRTAILDRMTASLCNAVTGREDGHEMLDRLEGSNLLISLDNRREWYRYHRLFAGALRATLSGERSPGAGEPGDPARLGFQGL